MNTKFVLKNSSDGKYYKKGSKFYSMSYMVNSIDDIKYIQKDLRSKYTNANHICYAYRIMVGKRVDEYGVDSGEPQGTAGMPILSVLKKNKLINTSIFVIRYFGGIKLGIPGLINAYSNAANETINKSVIVPYIKKSKVSISFNYKYQKQIESYLNKNYIKIVENKYDESIYFRIELEKDSKEEILLQLKKITNQNLIILNI